MKEEVIERKRFALLLACNDSEHVKKVYGGYLDVFVRAFGDEDETWDLFRVVQGEFPRTEDLDRYDGFVVSGSPHDAYGDDDWILELCFLLRTLYAMQKRVLGICFGHQVLCRALGGHVGKACTGWELGIRKMIIVEGLQHCRFLQGFENLPSSASIIECHQDEVWELPVGAEVLAFSEKTAVEAFSIGEHILGIQGHPEYTKDILLDIIDRLTRNNSINCNFADDAKANVEGGEPDRIFWEKLCKGFLKSTC
ncbi:putative glutamine amidotransferase [Iris pallida]|uniref:Glutamine amidotransferase n=1 Tax=Iris pallida TaxID=29817 RepID=A0AAX6I3K9_IRIPA|nr:putative glutamine amidotransferase [Iris pallida]